MEVSDYEAETDQDGDQLGENNFRIGGNITAGSLTNTATATRKGNAVPSKGIGALSIRDGGDDASRQLPAQLNAPATGGQSTVSGTTIPTEMYSKYRQLLTQKKDLKKELKKFDEEFQAKYGREPKKADKEVMRPLYQRYHEVKADLDALQAAIEASHGPMGHLAEDGESAMAGPSTSNIEVKKTATTVGQRSKSKGGSEDCKYIHTYIHTFIHTYMCILCEEKMHSIKLPCVDFHLDGM
jgi:hypothetical protein